MDDIVAQGDQPDLNIIGGDAAPYGKYPQVCQLLSFFQVNGSEQIVRAFCSATIINEFTIMTNAHCLQTDIGGLIFLGQRTVYCGVANSPFISGIVDYYHQFRDVKSEQIHPQFIDESFGFEASIEYDIALVQLVAPLVFNDFVQPTKLWNGLDRVPDQCQSVGFGLAESEFGSPDLSPVMREVTLTRRTNSRCQMFGDNVPLTDNNICFFNTGAENQRTCGGDSGGPALCGGVQVGITTYGRSGCDNRSYGGNMNVARFFDWIKDNTFHS